MRRCPLSGYNFNSRPCVRGDKINAFIFSSYIKFQLTPLREGRRDVFDDAHENKGISTHAPA